MSLPKNKRKFALWAKEETYELVEELYEQDNCKTRSEYIEKAIYFYSNYIMAEGYRESLPEMVSSLVDEKFDRFEDRMANLMFKLAVEVGMVLHVTAATNEIDEDTLSELRGECVDAVKRLNGRINFEQALKYQKDY